MAFEGMAHRLGNGTWVNAPVVTPEAVAVPEAVRDSDFPLRGKLLPEVPPGRSSLEVSRQGVSGSVPTF